MDLPNIVNFQKFMVKNKLLNKKLDFIKYFLYFCNIYDIYNKKINKMRNMNSYKQLQSYLKSFDYQSKFYSYAHNGEFGKCRFNITKFAS